jgi:hypothetical protein
MSFREKAKHELVEIGLTTLFFAVWLGGLMLLKNLVLEEYHIRPARLTAALIGAIVLAKVVLVLEHVPLGAWLRRRPPVVDLVLRTALYGLGVLAVLVLEKAFETRHEFGGFAPALPRVFRHPDMPHVWANVLCIVGALLVFNVIAVIREVYGAPSLLPLFFSTPPQPSREGAARTPAPYAAQPGHAGR